MDPGTGHQEGETKIPTVEIDQEEETTEVRGIFLIIINIIINITVMNGKTTIRTQRPEIETEASYMIQIGNNAIKP
jgi:hypothetical protein